MLAGTIPAPQKLPYRSYTVTIEQERKLQLGLQFILEATSTLTDADLEVVMHRGLLPTFVYRWLVGTRKEKKQ